MLTTESSLRSAITARLSYRQPAPPYGYRTNGASGVNAPAGGPPLILSPGTMEVTKPITVYGETQLKGDFFNTYVHADMPGPVFVLDCDYAEPFVRDLCVSGMSIANESGPIFGIKKGLRFDGIYFDHLRLRSPKGCAMDLDTDVLSFALGLDQVHFSGCRQALTVHAANCGWLNSRVQGERITDDQPAAMIDLRGALTCDGGVSRFDGQWLTADRSKRTPMFRVRPYVNNGTPGWASTLMLNPGPHYEDGIATVIAAPGSKVIGSIQPL